MDNKNLLMMALRYNAMYLDIKKEEALWRHQKTRNHLVGDAFHGTDTSFALHIEHRGYVG